MDSFVCAACNQTWQRKPTRGRVPKLCPTCREDKRNWAHRQAKTCKRCARSGVRSDSFYCGKSCAARSRKPKTRPVQLVMAFPHPAHQLGPLRQALADGDGDAVIATLKRDTATTEAGCWEWQRTLKDGYATISVAGKTKSVHRLMAEAKHGPLGTEPVHHRCANTQCVNPDHLQPVTHRENVAEMMARRYYVQRIAELEVALMAIDPGHPALSAARLAS